MVEEQLSMKSHFHIPKDVKAILYYSLNKMSGLVVTKSFLTKLPMVSENQFSAFYSIIGHFQWPLNSNFSPFTGQSIAKCKNSFALAYIFVISLIQVDHLARQEDCQNNWYSILRHPYILLEKFNTCQKLIIHRLAHIELILQVKRKSMKLYWLGRGGHHIIFKAALRSRGLSWCQFSLSPRTFEPCHWSTQFNGVRSD